MGWLIIIVLSIILGIVASCSTNDVEFGFEIVVICLIILAILSVIAMVNTKVVREYEEEQYKIQGLENNIATNQNTSGAFILGFGYINSSSSEEMKYYYFKVNELGKKLETIEITNYSDTYIRETDEIEPCLIYRYQETINEGFWKWLFGEDRGRVQIAEILVVPKNTIKIEYNVDIKE